MEQFFSPRSVAVIGASRDPNKVGHVILKNLLDAGFRGNIFPVNPKVEVLLGLRCYSSVAMIQSRIDTAIVAVPAETAVQVLDECGKKRIKWIIMVTAGFGEVGNKKLEEELLKRVKKYGMRLIGPNCLGTLDTTTGFDNLFLPRSRLSRPERGSISFICQSGAVGSAILDMMENEGMKCGKFVSYGNAVDVDESDLLEFLGNDPETRVICMYIEGVKDGKKFMRIAKKVASKKPIIAIKGGLTEEGAKATVSHTGSLAGVAAVYKGVMRQCHIINAKTLDELFSVAKIFEKAGKPSGRRVQIVTNGGGFGILAADRLSEQGLKVEEPSKFFVQKIRSKVQKEATIRNPMDLTGSVRNEEYEAVMNALLQEKKVDILCVVVLWQTPLITPEVVRMLQEVREKNKKLKKPKQIVVVSAGGSYTQIQRQAMEEIGIPTFTFPADAAKALRALVEYYEVK